MDWTADWFKVGVVLEVVDRFTSPLQKLHIETQKAKKALEDLWGASYKLAEILYREKASQATGGAGATGGTAEDSSKKKGGDDVIDTDFEEMK